MNEVYKVVESEVQYQSENWDLNDVQSLEQWLVYMETYINEAKVALTKDCGDEAENNAVEAVRKVAALAVAALDQFEATPREGYEEVVEDEVVEDESCDSTCECECEEPKVLYCPECYTDLVLEEGELVVYDEEEEEEEEEGVQ